MIDPKLLKILVASNISAESFSSSAQYAAVTKHKSPGRNPRIICNIFKVDMQ